MYINRVSDVSCKCTLEKIRERKRSIINRHHPINLYINLHVLLAHVSDIYKLLVAANHHVLANITRHSCGRGRSDRRIERELRPPLERSLFTQFNVICGLSLHANDTLRLNYGRSNCGSRDRSRDEHFDRSIRRAFGSPKENFTLRKT